MKTQSGLEQLFKGLPYVSMAKTFFGFRPEDHATDMKLADQWELIRLRSATKIEALWRGHVDRKYFHVKLEAYQMDMAVRKLQNLFRGCKTLGQCYECYGTQARYPKPNKRWSYGARIAVR